MPTPPRCCLHRARGPLLWLARRPNTRLVRGDLLLIFLIWYGTTRFVLEFMRTGNWTFFGIPMAQIVSIGFVLAGLVGLWYRHGPGRPAPEAEPVVGEMLGLLGEMQHAIEAEVITVVEVESVHPLVLVT